MATNNKDTMGEEHMYDGCCGMHHGHMGHFGFRLVLGVVILFMVFWLGMKLGEFKGFVEANYGYGFGIHGNMMYNYGAGPAGMMRYWQTETGTTQSTTSTTSTTPAPTTKK